MSSDRQEEMFPRGSGILLHITSLPGRYGIGDFGQAAYTFVDMLEKAGQTYWQVLPLGPTGYADSPYQCLSAFAGNTNLISLDRLEWLTGDDLADAPVFPSDRVDYQPVTEYHNKMLSLAFGRFQAQATRGQQGEFARWCEASQDWLEDYALFAALKERNGSKAWVEWSDGQDYRNTGLLDEARQTHAEAMAEQRFRQWVFHSQWMALKTYANERGIRIIGDLPIFAAHDSCDVWAHREVFFLDEAGNQTVVAGVPPDYFSPTGQLWGNPLYRWWDDDQHRNEALYAWWQRRIGAALELFDNIRIDHFRGFHEYYEIPAGHETAQYGRWVDGPRDHFFDELSPELKKHIIAEDLGDKMEAVIEWRRELEMPGMCILQFAFGGEERFLPHNHESLSVVYTGTHDNNTAVGWWENEATELQREYMRRYIGVSQIAQPNWEMIRLGMRSVARIFIVPMQDVLGLGSEARMNTPGNPAGNWCWRCPAEALQDPWRTPLPDMTGLYDRWPISAQNGNTKVNR